jgi:hypothetical protein
MRVELAQRYDVSIERGFAYITDTRNWPKSCSGRNPPCFRRTFSALERELGGGGH